MNGTVADAGADWVRDGLRNYQEYYVQAVRHFRYDIPTNDIAAADSKTGMNLTGVPMDATYHPANLFTIVDKTWDVARYPWGDTSPQLWVLLPVGHANLYVCTDPRDHDTIKTTWMTTTRCITGSIRFWVWAFWPAVWMTAWAGRTSRAVLGISTMALR
jgi:hypothetical protein